MEITKQAVKQVVEAMPEGGTATAVAFEFGFGGTNDQVTSYLWELYEEGAISRKITYTDTVFKAKSSEPL